MQPKDYEFLVVDLETTGLSPLENEIIEIGIVKVKGLEIVDTFSSLVKPKNKINHYITELTGISNQMLKDACDFSDILKKIKKIINKKSVFVAHNVLFDFDTLNNQLVKYNSKKLENQILDTQFLANLFYPNLSSYKLGFLADALGIEIDEALHRALPDAILTAKILIKFLKSIEEMPKNLLYLINKHLILTDNNFILKELFLKNSNNTFSNQYSLTNILKSKVFYNHDQTDNNNNNNGKNLKKISDEAIFKLILKKQKKTFTDYEKRKQQIEMISLIVNAFNDQNHLVIEAGTGTGKSLAYLLPSLMLILKNKQKVVIATKTKNLQEQIMYKDLPIAEKLLGLNIKKIILKGKENYACLRKLIFFLETNKSSDSLPLLTWLYYTKDGDISDLHSNIIFKTKNINIKSSECLLDNCPYHKYCFYNNLKRKAKNADLIIVNHALLLADIQKEKKFAIPKYDFLILDEAHNLEETTTKAFAYEFSHKSINELISTIKSEMASDAKAFDFIEDVKQAMFNLENCLKKSLNNLDKISLTSENFKHSWSQIIDCKEYLQNRLEEFMMYCQEKIENDGLESFSFLNSLEKIYENLFFIFEPEKNYVSWIEKSYEFGKQEIKIISAPANVNKILKEVLFDEKKSIVLTSATMAIKDDFNYFKNRLGLDITKKVVHTVKLGSPFNYAKQSLLCVPKDFPEPNASNFAIKVAEFIIELTNKLKGRVLVLFTSYQILQEVEKNIINSKNKHFLLLSQTRKNSRKAILDRFSKEKKVVLLGTDSFWEGIDLQNKKIASVVITKAPFFVPNDPIALARMQEIELNGGNGFCNYALPYAVTKFKQGFGRLIRNKKDKGVVVVLDNRIIFKSYGNLFLRSVPECEQVFGQKADIFKKIEAWF